MFRKALLALCALCLSSGPVLAAQSYDSWLQAFRREAIGKGISHTTVNKALTGIDYLPRVIELDRKQPESTRTFVQYRETVISQKRIDEGRELLQAYRRDLEKASERYGVAPEYIVALWGIETSYGANTGGFNTVEALATLAYDGRRSDYFRDELLKALRIIDEAHISAEEMKGSWAGAMGQNQFMPTSFLSFAVDGNKDGRRDIWDSMPDVFASTANYLVKNGWQSGRPWGRAVRLPRGFSESLSGIDTRKPLKQWSSMGVTLPNGYPLPMDESETGSIIVPDGVGGPAFLVYDNYRVFRTWNKSTYFATSVGLLADLIALKTDRSNQ